MQPEINKACKSAYHFADAANTLAEVASYIELLDKAFREDGRPRPDVLRSQIVETTEIAATLGEGLEKFLHHSKRRGHTEIMESGLELMASLKLMQADLDDLKVTMDRPGQKSLDWYKSENYSISANNFRIAARQFEASLLMEPFAEQELSLKDYVLPAVVVGGAVALGRNVLRRILDREKN